MPVPTLQPLSPLPSSFPTPDWGLRRENYPHLFLIDMAWCTGLGPTIELDSLEGPLPYSSTCFNDELSDEGDYHGEKTLYVVKTIARQLSDDHITLVSIKRKNSQSSQRAQNLPEAIIYTQAMLKKGDVVVINLAPENAQDSFSTDPLIKQLLTNIINKLDGIVIVAAGNSVTKTNASIAPGLVVAGGISVEGLPQSRYGTAVTCYGVVPYNFPDYPVSTGITLASFGRSSAATAYMAGVAMVLQNYARSKNISLTPFDVVKLLSSEATQRAYNGATMCVPDWGKLRAAINLMALAVMHSPIGRVPQ